MHPSDCVDATPLRGVGGSAPDWQRCPPLTSHPRIGRFRPGGERGAVPVTKSQSLVAVLKGAAETLRHKRGAAKRACLNEKEKGESPGEGRLTGCVIGAQGPGHTRGGGGVEDALRKGSWRWIKLRWTSKLSKEGIELLQAVRRDACWRASLTVTTPWTLRIESNKKEVIWWTRGRQEENTPKKGTQTNKQTRKKSERCTKRRLFFLFSFFFFFPSHFIIIIFVVFCPF
ncbi:hypothetical protein TcCL_ESM10839 [Trypanosoma cruzi]|nr:hypothetical protein TcCL_ESM10839 [Trypanosoma cruzi]